MLDEVGKAYSRRAAEYTELLGSMDAVHPSTVNSFLPGLMVLTVK